MTPSAPRPDDPQPAAETSIRDYLPLLDSVMRGIAATFGRNCEVVLHDLQHPDASIVAVQGNVTGREVGGTVSQIGLELITKGNAAEDQFNYITRAPNGRILKSSTMVLRDRDNRVLGLLCINMDVTELRMAAGVLNELINDVARSDSEPRPVAFVNEIEKLIQAVVNEEVGVGQLVDRMNKSDRIAIFQALDRRGVFGLQRSVPQVAEYLGISRATAYSYLEEIRSIDAKET